MNRRKVLKIFGALFVCLAGKAKLQEESKVDCSIKFKPGFLRPKSYTFYEEGIKEIIIEKKDGTSLIVPFSDIVKALES